MLSYATEHNLPRPVAAFLTHHIDDAPVLVIPITILGHLTAILTLIGENDAVIMNQQVHHTVKVAVEHMGAVGASMELLLHNDIQAFEKRLNDLTLRYQRVRWKCQN